jgi:hypothetical protein
MVLKSYKEIAEGRMITESAVLDLFGSYLSQGQTIAEALSNVLSDPVITESECEDIFLGTLLPEVIQAFSEIYCVVEAENPSVDLNTCFDLWCESQEIDIELGNFITQKINETASSFDEDEEDFIFKPQDWSRLSDEQRQDKVKAFLRALAGVQSDFNNNKPFIKNLDGKDSSYGDGNEYFLRQRNRPQAPYQRSAPDDKNDENNRLRTSRIPVSQEHHSLPNLPILENLHNPASHKRVSRYVDYVARTSKYLPERCSESPATQLKQGMKMSDEAQAKTLQSKDDRDTDWTDLQKAEFIASKRGSN